MALFLRLSLPSWQRVVDPGTRRADGDRGRSHHGHGHGEEANGDFKIATGRGGAGNMLRSKSPPGSRDGARHGGGVVTVEEERAASRERARSRERPHAAGRGGAGNIRSPSRSVATPPSCPDRLFLLTVEGWDAQRPGGQASRRSQGQATRQRGAPDRGQVRAGSQGAPAGRGQRQGRRRQREFPSRALLDSSLW